MHGNFEGINSFIPRGCAPVCNKYVLILCCFRDIARYSDSTDAETQLSPPYNTGVLEAPIRHTPGRTQNPIIHLLSRTQSHLCETGNLLSDNCNMASSYASVPLATVGEHYLLQVKSTLRRQPSTL